MRVNGGWQIARSAGNTVHRDYLDYAASLRDHALFLAAATGDGNVDAHAQVAKAAAGAGAPAPQMLALDDDHVFSANREVLGQRLVRWLDTDCAAGQRRR